MPSSHCASSFSTGGQLPQAEGTKHHLAAKDGSYTDGGQTKRKEPKDSCAPAYPASCPDASASTTASVTISLPRAQLTMYCRDESQPHTKKGGKKGGAMRRTDPRRMVASSCASNMRSVPGCSGQLTSSASTLFTSSAGLEWNTAPSSASTSGNKRCGSLSATRRDGR